MTKLEAIEELEEHDHAFLTPKAVKEFTEPFGFEGSTIKMIDNRSEFKGLYCPDVNEGDKVEGQDASITATEIADHLGLKYHSMFGRGSQLRSACGAVKKFLVT